MSVLRFTVRGVPGAQGSKKHVGHGIMVESSAKVKPWRSDVKAAAEAAIAQAPDFGEWPLTGAVSVRLTFAFARPKSHFGTGRNAQRLRDDAPYFVTSHAAGDLDKLVRSTLDALTAAGVFTDDSLVAVMPYTMKRYTTTTPGAEIEVVTLTDADRMPR